MATRKKAAARDPDSAKDPVPAIDKILGDAAALIRHRMKAIGLDVHHVILAVTPDGTGIIRSNVSPDALVEMAYMLADIADQTKRHPEKTIRSTDPSPSLTGFLVDTRKKAAPKPAPAPIKITAVMKRGGAALLGGPPDIDAEDLVAEIDPIRDTPANNRILGKQAVATLPASSPSERRFGWNESRIPSGRMAQMHWTPERGVPMLVAYLG